ncbi:MAG: SEC-C domain-containing protein, partial [Myxococcales bacterium]|nr:SEC-C domain-containing protein [Myxococcales bacterium]
LDEGWFIEERETEFVLSALVDPSLLDDPNLELDGGKVQWLARACRDLPSLLQQLYLRNRGRLPGEGAQAVSKKVERNAPCPCGSGRKYKKCCGAG